MLGFKPNVGYPISGFIPIWGSHWVIHSIGNCIFAITINYSFAKSCATQVQTSPSLRRVVWVVCVLFTHVFIMYNKSIRLLRAVLHRTKGLLGLIPDFSVFCTYVRFVLVLVRFYRTFCTYVRFVPYVSRIIVRFVLMYVLYHTFCTIFCTHFCTFC